MHQYQWALNSQRPNLYYTCKDRAGSEKILKSFSPHLTLPAGHEETETPGLNPVGAPKLATAREKTFSSSVTQTAPIAVAGSQRSKDACLQLPSTVDAFLVATEIPSGFVGPRLSSSLSPSLSDRVKHTVVPVWENRAEPHKFMSQACCSLHAFSLFCVDSRVNV